MPLHALTGPYELPLPSAPEKLKGSACSKYELPAITATYRLAVG